MNKIKSKAIYLFSLLQQDEKIDSKDTFRLTVEKTYRSSIRTSDIIEVIAREINNPLDLDDTEWIIPIEILGKVAGI
ncbi:MAG: hypothetical protein ACM3X1_08715 [Ignavibacteriales bacterium]